MVFFLKLESSDFLTLYFVTVRTERDEIAEWLLRQDLHLASDKKLSKNKRSARETRVCFYAQIGKSRQKSWLIMRQTENGEREPFIFIFSWAFILWILSSKNFKFCSTDKFNWSDFPHFVVSFTDLNKSMDRSVYQSFVF